MDGDSRKSDQDGRRQFGADTLELVIRERVREIIGAVIEQELEAALGASASQRTANRCGYRHGVRDRTLVTSLGPTTIEVPRARIRDEFDGTQEWHSQMLPRYQRRSQRVDEAILGLYLNGANSRRIKGALAPLLRGAPLGKDAVSRLVNRLADEFRQWQQRDLAEFKIVYTWHDGWYPKVRIGRQRVRVPVLVTLGATESGERMLLDMRLAGQESAAAWGEVINDLIARHIGLPHLAIIDGNPGLRAALQQYWPAVSIQRCTVHKLANLVAKAPLVMRDELTDDYRRMIYAETADAVQSARKAFVRKWRLRCSGVVVSLQEAGDELFTFLRFPTAQWKALRTTNVLERINQEFRRRTKTQAMLPSENAVLLLLYGLLRSGLIKTRKIDGWQHMPKWRATLSEQRTAA